MKNRDTFDRIRARSRSYERSSCPVLSLVALRSLKILPPFLDRTMGGRGMMVPAYTLLYELFRNFRVIIADSDTASRDEPFI